MKKPSKKWDGQRETLDDLAQAVHYNRWIYRMLAPRLGRRILEIGCGTGNLTEFLVSHGKVLSVDVHPDYLAAARRRVPASASLSYRRVDLEKNLSGLRSFKPDTIVCVNVLEHLFDDHRVLEQCHRLLTPGGRLLLFVPALPFLFGSMDVSYGHFRRYTLGDLTAKAAQAGFTRDYCRYLNLLGVLGWWWNGKVLRKKIIPQNQLLWYDQVIRITGTFERFLPKPLGLSLYYAGHKPARS